MSKKPANYFKDRNAHIVKLRDEFIPAAPVRFICGLNGAKPSGGLLEWYIVSRSHSYKPKA